jgi:uncharacterized protein
LSDAILPVDDDSGRVRLLGSRCKRCGECFYPSRPTCRNCSATDCEAVEFGPEGVLYTYTIVREPAASPPRAYGQVDFDGRVRVQARLVPASLEDIRIGSLVEAILPPEGEQTGGGFVFRPVEVR